MKLFPVQESGDCAVCTEDSFAADPTVGAGEVGWKLWQRADMFSACILWIVGSLVPSLFFRATESGTQAWERG